MFKKLSTLLFTLLCYGTVTAQSVYFHSLDQSSKPEVRDSTMLPKDIKNEEPETIRSFLSSLSANELEYVTEQFLKTHTAHENRKNKMENEVVLSLYPGEKHELTVRNLLLVMADEGISNKLFVLAQSMLETEYFKSNAARNLNNLFGLTNPRTGKLYHFDCWESSVVGYRRFVQYKYKGGNYLSFLKKIGYAEDPRYISKVVKISRQLNKELSFVD